MFCGVPLECKASRSHRTDVRDDEIANPYEGTTDLKEITVEQLMTGSRPPLIVGVDTSDDGSRDDVGFFVRDAATGGIIMTSAFNEINLIAMEAFIKKINDELSIKIPIQTKCWDISIEWIDSEIDKFMASLSSGQERTYSPELLELAEQIIVNNPRAFKDFL